MIVLPGVIQRLAIICCCCEAMARLSSAIGVCTIAATAKNGTKLARYSRSERSIISRNVLGRDEVFLGFSSINCTFCDNFAANIRHDKLPSEYQKYINQRVRRKRHVSATAAFAKFG